MIETRDDGRAFDVCGPLPTGVTVLEASAGTGKTYTIAALAARYVAEGTPLDQVLLVTFTRMATGELRERVRERLVSAEQALGRVLDGAVPDRHDEIVRLLADAPGDVVELRRDRLARALAGFDAATIATTHGFCQEALGGLGVAGDVERDGAFVEDVADLVEEVVDDLFVRRFHRDDGPPPFSRADAAQIARIAVANPAAPLEPADAPEGSTRAMRRRLAEAVRREVDERKRRLAVMTYDDLLTRLDDTLKGPEGPAAVRRLRERYRVVLVDEFQDTDPVQWDIMRRAFGDGASTLVLIGDPKQAIYAFRGADVYAYLEAARAARTRATLRVNWRSDQGLIDAYDALFGEARLGHEGIVYRQVRAVEANQAPRLIGAPSGAPLRLRVVDRNQPAVGTTRTGLASAAGARAHIAQDVAADMAELLSSGAEIEIRPQDGSPARRERVRPGHLAVLVRTNRNAADVREALGAAGIPGVINGAGSVFGTEPARDWLWLLQAIERPASAPRARAAALTPFFGWTTERVAGASEDDWEAVHRRLHSWARVLRLAGVASLTETITRTEELPGRILAFADGERRLTDLRHIAQLLHAAATTEQMGTTALTTWLRRRIAAAEAETSDEERSRRLESDEEAVQVLTIHRSKGLEFPIVYYPYLWEPGPVRRKGEPVTYHAPGNRDERTIDVGLEGRDYTTHLALAEAEQRGEDLRLAYVALTRAQHQAVVWWAGSWNAHHSSLGRLLFARDEDGTVATQGARVPGDAAAFERFVALADQAPGCVSVERSVVGALARWSPPAQDPATLGAAAFVRTLDEQWRRASYSSITAGAYEARVASEPEEPVVDDEPADAGIPRPDGPADLEEAALHGVPSLLSEMPVGVHVGTFVHRVLEAVDFAAPDLDAELARRVAEERARRSTDVGDPAVVVAGLRAALETPLGPVLGGARLRDVARADRLDELDFELPLVGGDDPAGRLGVEAVADVLRAHAEPGDALAGYAGRLDDPALRRALRGYLTGSIDVVLRTRDASGTPRYAIADYKTNRLAAPGEALTLWHHRPAALTAEMDHAHYGLQALLYTVALHRYLRWRVPGYDAERNLAGVLYLFLRGMHGADTPAIGGARCGVFAWQPPGHLVEALSDVLDEGTGG